MRLTLRTAALCLLALAAPLATATAQVPDIPEPRPDLKPAPTFTPMGDPRRPPTQPIKLARPTLPPAIVVLPNPAVDGKAVYLTIKLVNLGEGVTQAHVYKFTPGCDVSQRLGLTDPKLLRSTFYESAGRSGGEFRYNSDVVFNTPGAAHPASTRPYPGRPALAVTDGVATFQMDGRLGAKLQRYIPERGPSPVAESGIVRVVDYQVSGDAASTTARSCQASGHINVRGADGKWRSLKKDGSVTENFDLPETITGSVWRTLPARRVTINETATLKDLLKPSFGASLRFFACEGVSESVGQPTYRVGMMEIGGDIAFRIRSGPLGTKCHLKIAASDIPDGVTGRATWSTTKAGDKCKLGEPGAPVPVPSGGFNLNRSEGIKVAPTDILAPGTINLTYQGWLYPYDLASTYSQFAWHNGIRHITATLNCDMTIFNDHGIELRLDSVEFTVPDGVRFP